jgi:hypothetical protein
MLTEMDAYNRLRPCVDFCRCDCQEIYQLLLVYTLLDNPIQCFHCKGIVDPERISLTEAQTELTAAWRSVFSAPYDLWLDSDEYEVWAKTQLMRRNGRVNTLGLETAKALSESLPTYYWWFYDTDDPVPNSCPWCSGPLCTPAKYGVGQCDMCRIVV